MPMNVMQYDLLISCPGDIVNEVKIIDECVQKFNELYSDVLKLSVRTKHWHKSSYTQSGDKPQTLINDQFVKDCDAAVAIFWSRFGTPTDEYGSGTEEEISIMLDSGKQVFMYFSDKPISPSQQDFEERKKVLAFMEKYKDKGIYSIYHTEEEFRELFFAHLSQHFLTAKRVAEISVERQPKLKLLGIDEKGKLTQTACIQPFSFGEYPSVSWYTETIKSLYTQISSIDLPMKSGDVGKYYLTMVKAVKIEERTRKTITLMAETLKINLPDNFFDLGNLEENTSMAILGYGSALEGTEDEKKKYNLILELNDMIKEGLSWAKIENGFKGFKGVKLALENSGTKVDEDVEVTLTIPKNSLGTFGDFPELEPDVADSMINTWGIDSLFGIESTEQYFGYEESESRSGPRSRTSNMGLPGIPPDYDNDIVGELEETFCYSVFRGDENYIVKCKFGYIKHHTTIAFPTMIFLSKEVDVIPYTITSTNSAEVIQGIIKMK